MATLENCRIAILSENGFEESELTSPMQALKEAGAKVDIISPQHDKIKGWKNGNWSIEIPVDYVVDVAQPENYDGLVIPGGVLNPDKMRTNERCVAFAREFLEAGKPVAAICHGPQLLIETHMLEGRRMTSYQAIKTDMINAGVDWIDQEVVVDQGLVTSRSPADLPAFNRKMVEEFAEGVHAHARR